MTSKPRLTSHCMYRYQFIVSQIIKFSLYSRYYVEACNEHQVYLRGLAPGLPSYEGTSQRWRAVGDIVSIWPTRNLNPTPPAPIACALRNWANGRFNEFIMCNTVVLKLGTAGPLGSAKQFQGDRKDVADLRISNKPSRWIVLDWTFADVMIFFALHLIFRENLKDREW